MSSLCPFVKYLCSIYYILKIFILSNSLNGNFIENFVSSLIEFNVDYFIRIKIQIVSFFWFCYSIAINWSIKFSVFLDNENFFFHFVEKFVFFPNFEENINVSMFNLNCFFCINDFK